MPSRSVARTLKAPKVMIYRGRGCAHGPFRTAGKIRGHPQEERPAAMLRDSHR